jgi:RNA polymerase sigma-70 factor (ECF subfamily)
MTRPRQDWLAVQERLLQGDRVAFFELNRLITGILVRLRAYDFRDEWDDLRQEVLMSVVANARRGRLRDPQAFVGYVRIITRNKFIDRLKLRLRRGEKTALPWDEETAWSTALAGADAGREDPAEVWSEVRKLPEEQRRVVEGVYREGKTYQEVADATGIPLGTTKRRLRQAIEELRRRFGGEGG